MAESRKDKDDTGIYRMIIDGGFTKGPPKAKILSNLSKRHITPRPEARSTVRVGAGRIQGDQGDDAGGD